jgi:hypothetical protein
LAACRRHACFQTPLRNAMLQQTADKKHLKQQQHKQKLNSGCAAKEERSVHVAHKTVAANAVHERKNCMLPSPK